MLRKPASSTQAGATYRRPRFAVRQADVGATQLMQSYPWTVSKFGQRRPRPGSRRLIGPVMSFEAGPIFVLLASPPLIWRYGLVGQARFPHEMSSITPASCGTAAPSRPRRGGQRRGRFHFCDWTSLPTLNAGGCRKKSI